MHSIIIFYSGKDSRSLRALSVVRDLTKKVKELGIIGYDVSKPAGLSYAIKKRINTIPSLIIDGQTIIEGIPYSEKQIVSHFKKD